MEELDLSRSINLLSLIIIIGLFEGVFIALYLFLKKSVKSYANWFLAGILLVVVSFFLPGVVYRIGLLPQFPHVVNISHLTYFLFGPLAYFYVLSCSRKDFKIKPLAWLHFLPAVAVAIYHLPFFMQGGEEKIQAFADFFLRFDRGLPLWFEIGRVIHPVMYFGICIKLVLQYRRNLPNMASSIDHNFHRWLLYFCIFLLLPILTGFIVGVSNYSVLPRTATAVILFVFIMSIHIAILVKPSLFQVFPHQMEMDSPEEEKKKYESSNLQDQKKEKYVSRLLDYMDTEKPHLQSELTLSELSEQVKIPTHHLSQIINEKLKCNFLDFINGYRVKEVQNHLSDPDSKNLTILSLAFESGFNSKSTFYAAFKKQTSMTPNQYRAKQTA